MAADFTISQPGGAGSAPLNTDLENARVGLEIQFASLAPTGNLWALADKPDASSSSLGGTTSQVATLTVDGPGEYAVSLTQGGAVRVLVVEVNRDAAGVVLDYGLVAPARTHFTAGSVTGRGVARTMERFRNAVLVGIAAAIAAGGGGANLDPAGPLALGTVNATSVAIGRSAAPMTLDASTFGLTTGSTMAVAAAGSVSIAGRGVTLGGVAPTSDAAPVDVLAAGGDAWSSAVTNVTGGKLRLRGGQGKTLGTNRGGDVEISLGRLDSGSESAKLSIRYSSAGSDPFATEMVSLAKAAGGGGAVLTFALGSSQISGATITSSGGISSSTGSQGGSLLFSSFSSQVLKGYQVPTDAAPLDVEVQGAAANGSAVTNTAGGRVRIRGGAGTTGGTHLHGDVQVSVGRTVSNATAKFAIKYGPSTDPWSADVMYLWRTATGIPEIYGNGSLNLTNSNGGQVQLASSVIVSASTARIQLLVNPRTTDAAPPALILSGGNAWASAVTNKTGGSVIIEAGRGSTAGTDAPGPIYFGLGDEVGGVTDIANGAIFGTGPAVGSITAADYRPFTTEKGRLNVRYDRLCFNLGMLAAFSAAEPLYLYSNDINQYVGIGNAGISAVVNGTTVFNAATIGTLTITAASTLLLQSNGGSANLVAPNTQVVNVNGSRFEVRAADRRVKFQNYAASEDGFTAEYPVAQTLSADGLTTLVTLNPPTGAVWWVRGSIKAKDASANAWTSDFRFGLKNVAGTVTTFNVTKTEAGSGGSMASMTSDLPGAGATALIRASRPAGVSVDVKVNYWIES